MSETLEAAPATLVLVDDHAVVRAGLKRVLENHPEFTVIGEAGTLRDALEQVEIKRPSIVVLDIDLPDGDGVDAIPDVIAKGRGSKVLVLSMHDDPSYVERAFAAGADGYLLKDAAETELAAAIATLARGDRYVYPPLGATLAQAALARANDPLTEREHDIARLLALGHTNQEVAAQLFLSVRTVETHRSHLMHKLGLSTRAELVRWALDSGELTADRGTRGSH